MHYTSWDRSDRQAPVLLIEEGPGELGRFEDTRATVNAAQWQLSVAEGKASATLPDGSTYSTTANLSKDARITVDLAGESYTFLNESSANWIIEDAQGVKIAQFSGRSNGVRKSILEFEGEASLPLEKVAALSWFARLILEARLGKSTKALIFTLIGASVIALLTVLL